MSTRQFVVFKIDNEEFGIEISKVLFIEKPGEVYKVPETSSFIEGVMKLRGNIYPIYNIRKKFQLNWDGVVETTKIIVVNVDTMDTGFIVDEISEILKVEDENIEMTPEAIKSDKRKYLAGVAKVTTASNDKVILLLDLCKILSEEDQEIAESLINQAEA